MDENRLTELLNLYLDGNLNAAERQELERELLASPAARQHFWKYTSLHAFTLEAAQLKWSEHARESVQKASATAEPRITLLERALSWVSAWRWTWSHVLATSAGVVLVFAVIAVGYANRTVATLARAVDVEWVDAKNSPVLGADLKRGWLHLKQGAVEVTFRSGANVVFEAPADICLVSEMEARCTLGRFRAQVPPQAHGFKLSVNNLQVVDLGTEFGLSVPPSGSAEVHVFTGRVQVSRGAQDAPTLDLLEGEAVKAEGDGFSHMDANEAGFLRDSELARRGLPGLEQQRAAWRAASRALTMDPGTILHYTFLDQTSWSSILTN
ncbi:MAG TPA: hypothetical protein VMZ27_05330, partial [Candidatus Saccharimonadales bacterium]|nr:hypothetical protein [Candidatus Saccharimonadales bacterium]